MEHAWPVLETKLDHKELECVLQKMRNVKFFSLMTLNAKYASLGITEMHKINVNYAIIPVYTATKMDRVNAAKKATF